MYDLDQDHFPHNQVCRKIQCRAPAPQQHPGKTHLKYNSTNNKDIRECYERQKNVTLIITGDRVLATTVSCLQQSKAWTEMILYLAASFGTPCSLYAKCLPSLNLILGAVIGGPSEVPHILGAGG